MKKNLKIKNWILAGVCGLCIGSTAVAVGFSYKNASAATLSEISVQTEYQRNERFVIPDAEITVDGKSYSTEKAIIFPNGTKYATNSVELTECGIYTIEYSVDVNGKTHKCHKTFKVTQSNYSFANATYEQDGLHIVFNQENKKFVSNQIIDVSSLTVSDCLIDFKIMTDENKQATTWAVDFTLIDAYDPSNMLMIRAQTRLNDGVLYSTACFSQEGKTSELKGAVKGTYDSSISVGANGTWGQGWLVSKDYYSGMYKIDYAEKTVHNGYPLGDIGTLIADFDSPIFYQDGWKGFTTGEVYLSIAPQNFVKNEVEVVVSSLYDTDLSTVSKLQDTTPPKLEVDYGKYTKDTYPASVAMGESYSVYNAKAWDISGLYGVKVQPRVYFAYNSDSCFEVDIIDGRFTANLIGIYSIVYKAKDSYGNETVEIVPVNCVKATDELTVSVAESVLQSYQIGVEANLPTPTVVGAFGEYSVLMSVYKDGNEQVLTVKDGQYQFKPMKGGEYKLVVEVVDYLNRAQVQEYKFDVAVNDIAQFVTKPYMPEYLYSGYSFTIPTVQAFNYYTNSDVAVEVYLTDKNGTNKVTNGKILPQVANSYDKVTLTYKAGETEQSYEITVIKVGDSTDLKMSNFFVENPDVSKIATEDKLTFVATKDVTVQYSNRILAEDFSLKLDVDKNRNAYSSIIVTLYDSIDKNIAVQLKFARVGDSVKCYVNNAKEGNGVSSSFTKDADEIIFEFINSTSKIKMGAQTLYIVNDLAGNKFEGFPSQYITLEIGMAGVTGEAGVELYSISKQIFSSKPEEFIRPSYYIDGSYGGVFKLNDTYTFAKIYAGDVFSQDVEVSYSVYAPDGEILNTVDGTPLINVDGSRAYNCTLSQIGTYRFSLKVKDQNTNTVTFTYVFSVIDTEKPTISLSGKVPATAKVGNTIVLPKATASETLVGEKVYVHVIKPNGVSEKVENFKFVANQKGIYKVCYYAIDEAYNMTEYYVEIIVR